MSRIHLIAASDDYLLEERLGVVVAEVCADLGGVDPEIQADETTPESVATELVSPSLFASDRVLVVPDVRIWLGAPAPAGLKAGKVAVPDLKPLLQVLSEGVPKGMTLVMGAWCGRKPTGELVEAVENAGVFQWIPLPPPPKPWEDAVLSSEQRQVLETVIRRAANGATFSREAMQMLLERLGFAPRLLVQEVRKLIGAAGDSEVDEALVRRLTFPRERSLEVVRDAVLARELEPLLDLVAAASSGSPVNNWQGQRLDAGGLGPVLFGQVTNLQHQMLYARRFKNDLAPELIARLKEDAPSPMFRPGGKPPTPFSLGAVFAGAGRYSDDELVASIAGAVSVESGIRQQTFGLETLTAWLAGFVGRSR